MDKFKILCIDDESDILELYAMILGDKYEVLKAQSANEAIAHLKENNHNIIYIFSDFKMPEKNGFEIRKEILDLGYDIPFAIITGNYDLDMATKAMELHISSFLSKPFSEEELYKLIDDLGEKRALQIQDEKEMVTSFITESSPMLEEIEGLILILEENPKDMNAINTYFRLLHTIKGTASCVGLKSLPKFTHTYEDLVSLAKENKLQITPNIVDSLLYGLDRLKFMYDEIITKGRFEFEVEAWIEYIKSYQNKTNEEIKEKETHIESTETKKSASDKLAIPIETLDTFLELSGELTILRNTIYKAISRVELKHTNDKDIETLGSSIEDLHKITSIVQKQISEMRKIGAENITRPLKRVVRDTSKELGKNVELKINNENIKIDNTIAKIMSNSLVHLIRNSIDHGIEKPDARSKTGKPSEGHIEISFLEDGDTNIVVIKDDGAGINKKRVLQIAVEKGLITEASISSMSSQAIFSLIFESGFSTSQSVSSISGRGVGMDMVRSSIESIGGKIIIESEEGKGTCFTLVLPQPKNVLINKTLLIEEESNCYSIPIDDVVEVVKVTNENRETSIFSVSNHPVLKRYEELIPIIKLKNCLLEKGDPYENNIPEDEFDTIIVKHGTHKLGLVIDKVHDIEESVVRKIKQVIQTSPIYSGVTYFGDNELALILNTENITKENIHYIDEVSKSNVAKKINTISTSNESKEYFTFLVGKNQFAINKDKVFRIEILQSSDVQTFSGNHYMKYRDQILKIIAIDDSSFTNIEKEESIKLILINHEQFIYGLLIDEFYEFITSDFKPESMFSAEGINKGSIIHDEQIIYLVDEKKLDNIANSKIENNIYEEVSDKQLDYHNIALTKVA